MVSKKRVVGSFRKTVSSTSESSHQQLETPVTLNARRPRSFLACRRSVSQVSRFTDALTLLTEAFFLHSAHTRA